MTSEQIAKLPKWAQAQVREIMDDNTRMREQLEALQGDTSAPIYWATALDMIRERRYTLPNNASFYIRLKTPGEGEHGVTEIIVTPNVDAGHVSIHTHYGELSLVPQSQNQVRLRVQRLSYRRPIHETGREVTIRPDGHLGLTDKAGGDS